MASSSGHFIDEDAVGIFLLEAFEQSFGLGFLVGFVIGPRGEEIGVIVELFARLPCLVEARNSIGVALIEQVGVAESKVGGCGGFAGMRMRVGRDAGIGSGSTQGGQLLGHGAQFGWTRQRRA